MAALRAGMLAIVLAGIGLAVTPAADAGCLITGVCSSAPNTTHPGMGAWQYTLTVTWDTGTKYALSHIDLILTPQNSACGCQELSEQLQFPTPAGTSTGIPSPCTSTFDWILGCNGDPSIHLTDLVMKLEPRTGTNCSPGTAGLGTFTFFSDYVPVAVGEHNLFLVDKFGQLVCYGTLDGVFPGLPCDPTANEQSTWGSIKSIYGN